MEGLSRLADNSAMNAKGAKPNPDRKAAASALEKATRQRDEVRRLIALSGSNAAALSSDIGRGKDYLADFLKGRKSSISAGDLKAIEEIVDSARAKRNAAKIPEANEFVEKSTPASAIKEFDLRAGASYGGGYAIPGNVEDKGGVAIKAEWLFPDSWLRGEMRLSSSFTDILAVDGPSMLPDLSPGDRVLIDRSNRDPKQDAIFAVRDGDSVIIKHVQLIRNADPPRIVCRSSNPKYEPFELILDGEHVTIIGRVAGKISKM